MADIKHYLQLKKDKQSERRENNLSSDNKKSNIVKGVFKDAGLSEQNNKDYEKKIRQHRIKISISIAVCVVVFFAIALLVKMKLDNITYSRYHIDKSISREDSPSTQYVEYNSGYLKYSNDGISYYSVKGESIWNQTFSMQNPQVKKCKKTIAVGDINGTGIYIFNQGGLIGKVETALSIEQIEISEQGLVAAVLEDVDASFINLYNTNGEQIYTVKTVLSKDGYPLDISISNDGTKLIASYVYADGESIKTKVVFYNFSEVGQNETERVVGGFNQYGSTLVPQVQFVNNRTAVAVGENVISIYQIKEYPKLLKEINIDQEIEKVAINDNYIALIKKNKGNSDPYQLVIYNVNGNIAAEAPLNTDYNTIKFDGKSILLYSDTVFSMINFNGKTQFKQNIDMNIQSVLPLGIKGNYILVNSRYIQEIKLK